MCCITRPSTMLRARTHQLDLHSFRWPGAIDWRNLRTSPWAYSTSSSSLRTACYHQRFSGRPAAAASSLANGRRNHVRYPRHAATHKSIGAEKSLTTRTCSFCGGSEAALVGALPKAACGALNCAAHVEDMKLSLCESRRDHNLRTPRSSSRVGHCLQDSGNALPPARGGPPNCELEVHMAIQDAGADTAHNLPQSTSQLRSVLSPMLTCLPGESASSGSRDTSTRACWVWMAREQR
jgi:hypothetical protein